MPVLEFSFFLRAFFFFKLFLPCFMSISRIVIHINPIIKIISLVMRTPPIGLSIPSEFFLPLNNSSFRQPRTARHILTAPLIRQAGGGGLFWISAAATRSYTLQIMYSGSKSRNFIIFRIRFGPFRCCNHVVKLILIPNDSIHRMLWFLKYYAYHVLPG